MIRQRHKKRRTFVLLLALALTLLAGCAAKKSGEVTALSQLGEAGRKIGVPGDMLEYERLKRDYPQAEVLAYDNYPLAYKDVAEGRLDAYIYARRQMEFAIANGTKGVRLLPENYSENTVAVGLSPLSPIPGLQEKINAFIAALKADGTMDDMYTRWVVQGEDAMPEIALPAKPAYHLRVATTGTVMPYSYYAGPELRGFDIELARRFAAWLGADLAFRVSDFPGVIAAAAVGDVDCIMSNLYYSPEKGDAIPFSDPLFDVEITAMVRDTGAAPTETKAEDMRLDQMKDKRIGIPSGSSFDLLVKSRLPEAQLSYYNNQSDLLSALAANKIDAFPSDEPVIRYIMGQRSDITYISEYLEDFEFAYCFSKTPEGRKLCDEFSAFLTERKADGSLDALEEKWFGADESKKPMPDLKALPATNGTLRMATDGNYMPFEYVRDGEAVGYDLDLAAQFCEAYGYGLKIEIMNLDALLPAVQSGKCDFGGSALTITPERAESVLFSAPNYTGGAVLVVNRTGAQGDSAGNGKTEGFWDGILSSLEKTFVRENRWKLFLRGFANTVLITVLSILFGTALGFLLLLWCRNGNPFANTVTRFCLWLVQGMPMVVLLMILYYVIFGSTAISGLTVAVIGFTLTFGAAVFGMLKMGVSAVDRGQYEAAYALGHSNRHTFFRIILPQAVPHVLPAYQGEIVGLIKATAIVGYIAVQDLTKMGDIVRSRTYEAFFPLISVTVIYFALEGLLSFLVGRLQIRMDPRKRSRERILKGVNTHDQA